MHRHNDYVDHAGLDHDHGACSEHAHWAGGTPENDPLGHPALGVCDANDMPHPIDTWKGVTLAPGSCANWRRVPDAGFAIRSLSSAIEAYDSLLPAPLTLVGEHLQQMHGLSIDGEWRHAPDSWRRNVMSADALRCRHEDLHEEDSWNEASERHAHAQ